MTRDELVATLMLMGAEVVSGMGTGVAHCWFEDFWIIVDSPGGPFFTDAQRVWVNYEGDRRGHNVLIERVPELVIRELEKTNDQR